MGATFTWNAPTSERLNKGVLPNLMCNSLLNFLTDNLAVALFTATTFVGRSTVSGFSLRPYYV